MILRLTCSQTDVTHGSQVSVNLVKRIKIRVASSQFVQAKKTATGNFSLSLIMTWSHLPYPTSKKEYFCLVEGQKQSKGT